MTGWVLVGCAFIGGLIASLMTYFDEPAESRTLSPRIYWSRLILFNPFCGAFLIGVLLLDGANITHIFATYVGLSSPIIIKQVMSSVTGSVLQGSDIEN